VAERGATGVGSPALIAGVIVGVVILVGIVGAVIAWLHGGNVASSMAIAYYVVGGIVFLVGSFPTGGFSLLRGRTRRRPTGGGAMAAESMLLGALLLGFGVLLDVTRPF
jgi:hypothetical protein